MKTKTPNIVPVLILTLITSVTWVFFSIYRAIVTKPAPVVPEDVSKPLTPTLDKNALGTVSKKLYLDDSQIPSVVISGTSISKSPTPAPLVTPIATISAQTPTASPSAATGR